MDNKKMRAKMILTDTSIDSICKETGMCKSAYHRKMSGKSEFRQGEIAKITKLLKLTEEEMLEIFFDKKVS